MPEMSYVSLRWRNRKVTSRGGPDAALVSAGGEMKRLSGFSLAATFEGEFSGNTTSYSRKLVARTRGELGCRGSVNWLAGVWLVGVGRSFLTFSLTESPKDNSMTSSIRDIPP